MYDILDDGLKQYTEEHNLIYKIGGRENKTSKKNKNYKTYYNQESIDLIAEKCKLELDIFNFDFDGYKGKEKIMKVSDLKIDWAKILKR